MKNTTSEESSVTFAPVLTKHSLAERTEALVAKDGMRYSEAVCHICDELGIEPTDVAILIRSGPLRDKIEAEALKLNCLKGPRSNTASLIS